MSQLTRLWHFSSSVNSFFKPRMLSHPVELDVWFLVGPFVYFHTSCVRTAKALTRLRGCAGSPEHSLVAYNLMSWLKWFRRSMYKSQFITFGNFHKKAQFSGRLFWNWAASWKKTTKWHMRPANSDQPGHPPSLILVFAVRSVGSSGPKLSSCGQRRL